MRGAWNSPAPPAAGTGNEQLAGQKDGDGALVDANTTNTTLRLNAARRNRRGGIHVLSARTLLARNGAFANGALGIDAVAGVTDGGGNVAHGNGNSAQCSGSAAVDRDPRGPAHRRDGPAR